MSKFSNFKIKRPKPVKKLENGGRSGPLRQNLPPEKNSPLDPPVTGWVRLILFKKIRIFTCFDLVKRGGVEWISKFCPVKGSSSHLHPQWNVLRRVSLVGMITDQSDIVNMKNMIFTLLWFSFLKFLFCFPFGWPMMKDCRSTVCAIAE